MIRRRLFPTCAAVFGAALAWAGAEAQAITLLIDFGGSGTQTTILDTLGRRWNNVTDGNDLSGSPFTLLDASTGLDSGFRLTISNPAGVTNPIGFNGANANGTTSPTGAAAAHSYPTTATQDSLYGNSTTFGSGIVQSVRLTISNLNPAELYSFDFFASRIGAGGDNRNTEYFITGGAGGTAASSVFLNPSENTGAIASASGFAPNASGQIVIDVDAGPGNNNSTGFYYLGVMEVNSVPEPSTMVGLAMGAGLLLARRRRG